MKKLLSTVLTVMLIAAILPFNTIFAYAQSPDNLWSSLANSSGGTVALSENVQLSQSLLITGGSHVLDLSGFTVSIGEKSSDSQSKVPAIIVGGGSLTIKDSVGGGKIAVYGPLTSGIELSGGSLVFSGGTLEVIGDSAPLGIIADGSSSLTISGGNVKVDGVISVGVAVRGEADFTMTSGSISVTGASRSIGLFINEAVQSQRATLSGGSISGGECSVRIAPENAAIENIGKLIPSGIPVALDGAPYDRSQLQSKYYGQNLVIGSSAQSPEISSQLKPEPSSSEENPNTGAKLALGALIVAAPLVIVGVVILILVINRKRKSPDA